MLDIDVQALVNVNFKSIGITDPRDRVKPRLEKEMQTQEQKAKG